MSKLTRDIGENYEYIRTIVDNKIELLKLNAIEDMAQITSIVILSIFLFVTAVISVSALFVVAVLLLAPVVGTYYLAILLVLLAWFGIGAIVYLFRKNLVYKPVSNSFFKAISNRI